MPKRQRSQTCDPQLMVDSPKSESFRIDSEHGRASITETAVDHDELRNLLEKDKDQRNGKTIRNDWDWQADPQVTTSATAGRRRRERENTLLGSDPTCLPPITEHRKRTIVMCFDGTGDQFDSDISNVAKLFTLLKKDDRKQQVVYYQAGIGTQLKLNKAFDSAVASYLSLHVKQGYEFLMQTYNAGDKVCIFGFSRGAYTARVLSGMLHKVGLLPANNKQQIAYAWRMFKDTSDQGWELSRQFKDGFCVDVNVAFLGAFDTVSSVGMLFSKRLPFASSNYGVHYFRHAMALDERRARFKVNHWGIVDDVDNPNKKKADDSSRRQTRKKREARSGHELSWREEDDVETDVQEVWFAGGHADVGGGNAKNDVKVVAANIPLRWMVRECFRCETGILFDIHALKQLSLNSDHLFPEVIVPKPPESVVSSPEGSIAGSLSEGVEHVKGKRVYCEEDPELQDAHARLYDQLAIAKVWWVLELFPVKGKKHLKDNLWKEHYFVNFGRGRVVPKLKDGMRIHRSVKLRLEKGDYRTRAIYDTEPIWVD